MDAVQQCLDVIDDSLEDRVFTEDEAAAYRDAMELEPYAVIGEP